MLKLTLTQKIEEPLSTCVIPNYNKCSKLTLTQKIEETLSMCMSACSESSLHLNLLGLPQKCDHHPKFVVFVLSNQQDILPIEYFYFHCLLVVFSSEHNISIVLDDVLSHWYLQLLYFANSFLHKIKLNLQWSLHIHTQ